MEVQGCMPVPRDGGGVVSWIYIADAAAATVAALERGRPGQAYNIIDDEPVNWRQFIEALAEAFGAPRPLAVPRWIFRSAPYTYAVVTSTLRVSNAKAKRELRWAPGVPTYRDGNPANRPCTARGCLDAVPGLLSCTFSGRRCRWSFMDGAQSLGNQEP